MDEGLRVVKESLNQQKDRTQDTTNSYPRPQTQQQQQQQQSQQQAAQQDGTTAPGGGGGVGGGGGKHNSNSTVPPVSTPASSVAPGRLVSPPTTYGEMFNYSESKVRVGGE